MTVLEWFLLLFFGPFVLIAGAIFASFALDLLMRIVGTACLICEILWEASHLASKDVWNWRKK